MNLKMKLLILAICVVAMGSLVSILYWVWFRSLQPYTDSNYPIIKIKFAGISDDEGYFFCAKFSLIYLCILTIPYIFSISNDVVSTNLSKDGDLKVILPEGKSVSDLLFRI